MNDHNMEYNSQKAKLIIPEYGRNVQLLIEYAKEIEDPEYRQAFSDKIIDLMMQMHPQNRNVDDYKIRLWKHFFHIASYDIDVMPPNNEIPRPEDAFKKPDKVDYPLSEARYRHYGNNVQQLIKKALSMEEGPMRDGFVAVIGNYMKLAYKTWNREHYISDEIIKRDLDTLSGGKLILKENTSLDTLSNSNKRRSNNNNNNNYKRKNNSRGGGRNKNHRRR